MKKSVLIIPFLALALFVASGCSAVQFNAFSSATQTPSRTPRPTFTPRPAPTDIPTDTATPAATATAAPTDTPAEVVEDTPTPKPVAVKTNRPAPTKAPPEPTKPAFPVFLDNTINNPAAVRCESNTYEIVIIAKTPGAKGKRHFAGGYNFALLDPAGNLLRRADGVPLVTTTKPDGQTDAQFAGNCIREASNDNPYPFNGKLDATDPVKQGITSMILRAVKSPTDMTPLSADYNIDFSSHAQYWMHYSAP